MNYLKVGIGFLIAFLMQNSFINLFSIDGHTPNLLLAMVLTLSFVYETEVYGIAFGAAFGVLYDICWSGVVGPTPIALVVVSFLILFEREYVNRDNRLIACCSFAIAVFLFYSLYWCLQSIAENTVGYWHSIVLISGSGVYTIAVTIILFLLLLRFDKKLNRDRVFK